MGPGASVARFAPAPATTATVLLHSIERFVDPFPSGAIPIDGHWTLGISFKTEARGGAPVGGEA